MPARLVTEQVKLNGVRVTVTHSSALKLPKKMESEPKATNNTKLKKLASEVLGF